MAADGRVVIDVILDDGTVAKGVANIGKEFDGLDKTGTSKLKSLGNGIKTLATVAAVGATAVVGIGAAIGGLAAPIVQAAASAEALNAQFTQVFGNLEKQAQTSVEQLGSAFGMLPDRIKPMFTKTTSQFRGLGLDVEAAMKKAEQATSISANAAAFFDVSMESAGDSLNSFIKGNYEGGEAIGVFANETQMANYAIQSGLVKSSKEWSNLDEATKQATRLDYAESMLVAAGAIDEFGKTTGQASRESDSLENQLGNLKQAWENLKALLGAPLLEPVIQGIKWLTELIQDFDTAPLINAFELAKTTIENVFTAIKEFVAQFITENQEKLAEIAAAFETALQLAKSYVQTGLKTIKDLWTVHGTTVIEAVKTAFGTVQQIIETVLKAVVPFIQDQLSKIKQFWDDNGKQILEAVKNAFEGIKAVIEFIMPAVQLIIEYVWDAIKNVINGALDVIMGLIKTFSSLLTGDFKGMWEGIKQIFGGAIDLILGLMSLSFVGGIRTLLTNLGKAALSLIKNMWDDIFKIFSSLGSKVVNSSKDMASKVISYFTNLFNKAKNIFGTLKTFGETTWNALKTVVTNAARKIWDDVVKSFTGLLNSVKTTMNSVKTTISDLWAKAVAVIKPDSLLQVGKDVVNGLIKGIGDMFGGVKKKIEALAALIPDWAKDILGIASPSKVFTQIGKWISEGWAIGIEEKGSMVENAVSDIALNAKDIAEHFVDEEKKLRTKANADIAKIETDKAAQIAKIEKRMHEDVAKAQRSASSKKKKNTQDNALQIQRIRENAATKIANIEESSSAKIVKIKQDSNSKIFNLESEMNKMLLDETKRYIDDKKSLDQLSLVDEALIWEQTMELFDKGTTERIKAQQNYQKAVEAVQKELVSINADYSNQIQKVHDDMAKQEETLTKAYEDAVDKRAQSLVSFKNLFDEFKVEIDVTGEQLLVNLGSQVEGFKRWQQEVKKLSEKAIDKGLLEELRQMGPNALPELIALNQLTDAQLKQYSDLYKEKSKLARTQAESELIGMKNDTDKQITELRKAANKQLDLLKNEWDKKIKSLTKATATELSSLKQVGKDAGQGLLDGLASMEGPLQSKARQIADSIKSTIQSALDIHSPSRWMRDFVAGNLAKGFVVGIDKNEGLIAKASEKLGDLVKPNIVNPLRGVRANLGNLTTLPSINQSSSNISNDNRRSFAPQIVNHFTPAQSTPSENARKQEQLLRRLAMEY